MKRFICTLPFLTLLLSTNLSAQWVTDVPPNGLKNIRAVEGGGIPAKIDSITPLNDLMDCLDLDWRLEETGKGYWIGYTDEMYSLATRCDTSVQALLDFISRSKTEDGKIGAIYTIHLI